MSKKELIRAMCDEVATHAGNVRTTAELMEAVLNRVEPIIRADQAERTMIATMSKYRSTSSRVNL